MKNAITMKTRKLLALLLVLPLLTWCQKPAQEPVDDNNNQEQGQGQGQGTVDPGTTEDPYAEAAPELKNGAELLVTNEMVQAFLEKVKYPERDYSETHIRDEEFGQTCPGNGRTDKPNEFSLRWTKDEIAGTKTVKLWEDDGWSRELTVDEGEYYVNLSNFRPNAHYHYELKNASGKVMTSGEFTTKGLVYQVFFKANVRNARDLGGWKTKDGKTVKYRMVYRGGRLQASTLTSKRGKDDLKAQGIKAQLDLRGHTSSGSQEYLNREDSPIEKMWGDEFAFCAPGIEEGYTQMLRDDGPKVKQCFEFVAQSVKDNKPVYFHCSLGRDRTGTLAMLLLGVLGVDEGDISKEYELTQFAPHGWATSEGESSKMTRRVDYKGAANYIWENFSKKDDGTYDSFASGIEKYLISIGVSQETIDGFRSDMLQ